MSATTQVTRSGPLDTGRGPTPKSTRSSIGWALLWVGVVGALIVAGHNLRPGGDLDPRISNPAVHGHPRPVRPLFGDPHWIAKMQWGTVAALVLVIVLCFVMWRRHPKHPILLMAIAVEAILWMDPVMNWAPYAVYNPQLWHWPESWALVSLSPTVEPLVVFGYVTFYLLPFFPAIWILRRAQRRRPRTSFVWRHPLISLAALVFVIGFLYDAMLEVLCIRAGLYIYSQVIPFGSIFAGKAYQFPLLWESSLITVVMIPAAVMLYRDESGRTVAEKLAQRAHAFPRHPALGLLVVMFAVISVAYAAYGGGFAIIKWSRAATSVACPYPYPEAKVYDPQGFYAKAGQPGPYFSGIWNGWEAGHSGRPATPTALSGRCSPS
ncbi:MAG TPA: spirocyclase AveC family protein [Mycobacteriales bacterium]|nr:spirocyclase AveC family protein [Mycobacteriales bacterium]